MLQILLQLSMLMPMASRGRARNGQGSIKARKLVNGTVVYDAWSPPLIDPVTGKKTRYPKRGLPSETAAARWIAKTVADNEAGRKVVAARGGLTVDEVAERWQKASSIKASTAEMYVYNYKYQASHLIGSTPIGSIRSTHIDTLFSTLRAKYSPSVLVILIRALTHFWDYAVRDGQAAVNVIKESPWRSKLYREEEAQRAERVTMREDEEGGLIRVFTPDQFRTLVESERIPAYRHLWQFIVLTGARRGEALGLRWSDVDHERRLIWLRDNTVHAGGKLMTVNTPKGNRRRRIYVSDETLRLLDAQRELVEGFREKYGDDWQEHDLVFPRYAPHRIAVEPMGGRQNPKAVSETFLRRTRTLGLPHITLHGLRHTCASAMYAEGTDIKTIQDHLGHRVDVTTLVYVHTDTATKREAVTRVVDYLGRKSA
ncbi:tyrosine-type recombinase/integrase [Nonomuraea polychroma]|uniref:tyrosine-type recombinase/integrase n=1 Tax=Nonomuraea polychroma TaxID=46176 RepID=UPI003D8CC79A